MFRRTSVWKLSADGMKISTGGAFKTFGIEIEELSKDRMADGCR
jgi:hypothetical protein